MNHIYRVVYNHHTHTYQAVSEISKGVHKTHSECNQDGTFTQSSLGNVPFFRTALTTLAVVITALGAQRAHAAPTDGQVVAGQANITQAGAVTNIHQASQNAVINWQQFGIKADETVNFKQPNAQSVTLNRVIGNEKSVIDGAMNANGKVFIQNPSGTLIGKNAQINVGGLVATTATISDDDFMNGRYQFNSGSQGAIENLGHINVPEGGVVALIAPIVKNGGTITAPKANVLLASAERFSITLPDNQNFAYTLDQGTLQGLVDNGGAILADGGHVVLTAKGIDTVKKSLIKHSGVIEANTVQNKNGVIELLGDLDNSALTVSGSLKAEAKASGDGGFIETSASDVSIDKSAVISTKSESGETGTFVIGENNLVVADDGTITADGVKKHLEHNNLTLKGTNGGEKRDEKGNTIYSDITVNQEIDWDKNTLTLHADKDIFINQTLNGTDNAKLSLITNGQNSEHYYNNHYFGYFLQKDLPIEKRTAKINLPAGYTFSTGTSYDTKKFLVVHEMPEIKKDGNGIYVSELKDQHIAFGKDIDLGYTKNYHGFGGWATQEFSEIHGFGHHLNNLTLNTVGTQNYDGIGLFSRATDTLIRDIGLNNVDIKSQGSAGGLVGSASASRTWTQGTHIYNSFSNGNILGLRSVGGLTGSVRGGIYNSHSSGTVKGTNTVGGLTGWAMYGIKDSHSTANVYGIKNTLTDWEVDVKNIGGLVGTGQYFSITNSYASGDVTTNGENVGGLVGDATNSYDGFINSSPAWIENSYSSGTVTNYGKNTGGLIGNLTGTLKNSYTTSNVIGGENTGGLVGNYTSVTYDEKYRSLSNNYVAGKVKGSHSETTGAIIGSFQAGNHIEGNIESTFFDGSVANINNAIGQYKPYDDQNNNLISQSTIRGINMANVINKSTSEMQKQSTFKDKGWDFNTVWRIQEGVDYPRLRALTEAKIVINPTTPVNPTNIGIKANDLNKVYDGKEIKDQSDLEQLNGWNGTGVTVLDKDGKTVNVDLNDSNIFTGKLRFDGEGSNWQNARNAGKYTIVPTGLSGGQKYEIEYGNGILTIDKKPVTIQLTGSRTYDGTTTVNGSEVTKVDGIVDSDKFEIEILGTAEMESKNAGSNKLVSHNFRIDDDFAKNYTPSFDLENSFWTIKKAPLNILGVSIYNGTDKVKGEDVVPLSLDLYDNDVVAVTGLGALKSKNAIIDSPLSSHDFLLSGNDANNYEISSVKWTVKPAPLSLYALTDKKYFDGHTWSFVEPNIVGLQAGDTIDAHQEFDLSIPQGQNKSILKVVVNKINDGNSGKNYIIDVNRTAKGTIFAKNIDDFKVPVEVLDVAREDAYVWHNAEILGHDFLIKEGFHIGSRKEEHMADGSVKYTFPIFNKMRASLEIQVLDKYGNVVDSKIADPNYHSTSAFGHAISTMIGTFEEGWSPNKSDEHRFNTKKTDISLIVPEGGSVKFTYNSQKAKLYNFVEPVTDLINHVLPQFETAKDAEGWSSLLMFAMDEALNEYQKQMLTSSVKGEKPTTYIVDSVINTLESLKNGYPELILKLGVFAGSENNLTKLVNSNILNQVEDMVKFKDGLMKIVETGSAALNLKIANDNFDKNLSKYDYSITNPNKF